MVCVVRREGGREGGREGVRKVRRECLCPQEGWGGVTFLLKCSMFLTLTFSWEGHQNQRVVH
ncbi:unnamed protein product [Chondrus crispus]|uniref:Uncharacterized protein n=1 Tax=Chondrus crispus TaxID=2769 RepID=R7QKX4_CHOCR|nr:unnamed protein product [Chondrus crispus]CDF38418.1 unnamed protein product [Chondrus crispus]|eukprot:XP_005718311.1 unnamed protein product [Chondrus crispus]